jgi:hypothetical protein
VAPVFLGALCHGGNAPIGHPAAAPVPNELVSLEHEIGELETDAVQVQTPTGSSRLVNQIRIDGALPDNVVSPNLIHPRGKLVRVSILMSHSSNQLIFGSNGTSRLGTLRQTTGTRSLPVARSGDHRYLNIFLRQSFILVLSPPRFVGERVRVRGKAAATRAPSPQPSPPRRWRGGKSRA